MLGDPKIVGFYLVYYINLTFKFFDLGNSQNDRF
jgi:hypothetical protein